MENTFKVVFTGKFKEIDQCEIRQRLLKLYKGNQKAVNHFFSGRSLIVKKETDYKTAKKFKALVENAGALCSIVEIESTKSASLKKKVSQPKQPAPQALPGEREKPVSSGNRPLKQGVSPQSSRTASKPSDKSLLSGSKLQNALAAVMIILFVISVGIRLRAMSMGERILKPDQVESNGKNVIVHFNGFLYFLTPQGKLQKNLDLAELGIYSEPADLQLLKDGSLLVGDLEKGEILRCDFDNVSCLRIGPAGDYRINENFKFLADEERNLLFIADTNNHSLMVQDMEGSYISGIESESRIRYPNDMVLDRDGQLWLSNTRYSQVVSFTVDNETILETEKLIKLRPRIKGLEDIEESMKDTSSGEAGDLNVLMEKFQEIKKEKEKLGDDLVHTRPLALAWDGDGNLWAVASDGFITTAGVRVFNPDGEQIMRVALGEKAVPVDIAEVGGNMLVADSGLYMVLSVDIATGDIAEFGDEGFLSEISRYRSELRLYEGIKLWSGRGIWILALGTIILVLVIIIGNYKIRARRDRAARAEARSRSVVPSSEGMQTAGEAKSYPLTFTGSAGEYFRIWIVNTFLTIVTFGVYAAWAKVRTRRYFYRNTHLDGNSFDYTADPMAIFKGYVIVGSGLLIYYLSQAFIPTYSLIIFGLFGLIIPILMYKSIRFFTRNSVYRNIRMRFHGSLGESYRTYLLYPLLIPFTLGLIVPYWAFLKKKYFFHNLAFGTTNNSFSGSHGPFYKVYVLSGLAVSGAFFILFIIMSIIMAAMAIISSAETDGLMGSILFTIILTYATMLIVTIFLQQFIYAWELNYSLRNSKLGELMFESTLNGVRLFWIRISNLFAIVFSMGLLIPWAKVRRMRYIVDNISVVTDHGLDDFTATVGTDESAYGDAATDFFDFDIGL